MPDPNLIVFFPWVHLSDSYIFGGHYELRNLNVFGGKPDDEEKAVRKILRCYRSPRGEKRTQYAILQKFDGATPIRWKEAEAAFLFRLRDYIAFSALAEVSFFESVGRGNYANNSVFKLVVQKYTNNTDHQSVVSQRRDGVTLNVESIDQMQFWEPHQVSGFRSTINVALVNALLASEVNDDHPLHLAISHFNQSWTDEEDRLPHIEIVQMCSAFEELFRSVGIKGTHKDTVFAKALCDVLGPSGMNAVAPTWGRKFTGKNITNSYLEAWAKDFFNLRGDIGHGHHKYEKLSCWTLMEHRVLASYIFPLAVKAVLKQMGIYNLEVAGDGAFANTEEEIINIYKQDFIADARKFRALNFLLAESGPFRAKGHQQSAWSKAIDRARQEIFREGLRSTVANAINN